MITSLEDSSKAVQILSTQSRRADLSPVQLKNVHRRLGQLLSYEYVKGLHLEPIDIIHVQGVKKGLDLAPQEFTIILTLMRSGLYVADGFREIFDSHARLEFISEETDLNKILSEYCLEKMNVVLVDSVINTGQSIRKIIDVLPKCKTITVICQVMHAKFVQSSLGECEDIHFITCRISRNFYVGNGKTDTGNRLFGHIPKFQTEESGNIGI
ncbi:uracil phosphoribosyltransferase [Methanogenium sp. MK-MG]|uniref:uracil phosphoribosyltransferase n=1 Tax=Methanogenium sp. MK-MG TaxID=2599926 RepID=UPI0013ED9C0A|nr:uracil phosphoribosyltransferase [Methanogenium sp. MK-MG]KAF1073843.1 hypothetical protein MKMG_02058 [Methanogenium sp. MK-MG]